MKLILGGCKISRSWPPPARISKVYTEAFTGVSYIFCPDGFNNILLSQGCVLKVATNTGFVVRTFIPRTGERVGSL